MTYRDSGVRENQSRVRQNQTKQRTMIRSPCLGLPNSSQLHQRLDDIDHDCTRYIPGPFKPIFQLTETAQRRHSRLHCFQDSGRNIDDAGRHRLNGHVQFGPCFQYIRVSLSSFPVRPSRRLMIILRSRPVTNCDPVVR